MGKTAVIIDPYLGARLLAEEFARRQVRLIGVFSREEALASMPWYPEPYESVHYHDGNLERLIALLEPYDLACIVPGNEAGVELAGDLAERLTPHLANAPGTSLSQRDKGYQSAALESAGVPMLRTLCSDNEAEIAEWIEASGLTGSRLVVKPPKSAGTDSVHLVPPYGDWRQPFREILGEVNQMGVLNDRVVIMEFGEGPEFMVDTYSAGGKHGLVMVSIYGKHNRGSRLGIYDMGETIAPDDPRTEVLFQYTVRALDAVGIRNASSHAEVILTPDGPRLVEVASRFSGSCMQLHQRISTGDSQVDRAIRHYLDDEFRPDYQMVLPARTAWLSAHSTGRLENAETFEEVRKLPTFADAKLPRPGMTVARTLDIDSSIGWVILASPDPAAIQADYRRLREIEANLVFTPLGS